MDNLKYLMLTGEREFTYTVYIQTLLIKHYLYDTTQIRKRDGERIEKGERDHRLQDLAWLRLSRGDTHSQKTFEPDLFFQTTQDKVQPV